MCLAVPGQVIEIQGEDGDALARSAWVDFGGASRAASLALLPEARVGDFVLVHAGLAICRVDAEEAARAQETFEALAAALVAAPLGGDRS